MKLLNLSRENKGFGLLELFINGGNCIFYVFAVMFFKSIGYSGTRIGMMLSTTVFISMTAQIVTGYASDNIISIKKLYAGNVIGSIVFVTLLGFFRNSFAMVYFLYALACMTGKILVSTLDSYITKLAKRRSGLDYGIVRGIGSFGFAVVAVFGGAAIDRFGINIIFFAHAVVMVVAFVVLLFLEDVPVAGKNAGVSVNAAARILLKTRGFICATLATASVFTASSMSATYLPITIPALGGSGFHSGLALSLAALCEVPVMLNFHWLKRRFTNRQLVIFSFCMFFVKVFGVTFFFSVNGILFFQLFQSVSYGLFMPSMLRFMAELVPDKVLATAIMLWSAVYTGLGWIIGSMLGGFILDHVGPFMIYYVSAGFALMGVALLAVTLFRVRRSDGVPA